MKKILYLITSSEYGGAQKYILDLAANLPSRDYQVIVAAGDGDDELFNRLAGFPMVKTVKISNLKRLPCPLTAWQCLKEIIKLLIQENPDILHLNSTVAGCLGSWAAQIYKKKTKANLKVIYTVHGWVFLEPGFLKSKIYFFAEKISAKWKDLFIVLSENDLQIGRKKKIAPTEKIVRIYNGLDVQSLHFLPKKQARKILPENFRNENKTFIGTIANFYTTKGLPYFIEAANILTQKKPNIGFVLVGDGPQRKKLKNIITQLGLNKNVFLTGRIPEASQYLPCFDIFVLPSLKEGFPWVILEAMAAAMPIIATNVGGIPELIENGKSGILVEPRNSRALSAAIEGLLNNPTQQKSLASWAKQRITKFSLSQMLNQTYSLY